MEALRNIYNVQNNQILIDLPKSFLHKSVEVIILPIYKDKTLYNSKKIQKKDRLKKLLSISIWNEEDIQLVTESKNLINQWKIEEF